MPYERLELKVKGEAVIYVNGTRVARLVQRAGLTGFWMTAPNLSQALPALVQEGWKIVSRRRHWFPLEWDTKICLRRRIRREEPPPQRSVDPGFRD